MKSPAPTFDGLRMSNGKHEGLKLTYACLTHNVPTTPGRGGTDEIDDEESRVQLEVLEKNALEFNLPYIPINDINQGIVHAIGPEQGLRSQELPWFVRPPHRHTWCFRRIGFVWALQK